MDSPDPKPVRVVRRSRRRLLDLPLADPTVRAGAAFMDGVVALVLFLLAKDALAGTALATSEIEGPVLGLGGIALLAGHTALETSRWGATPGKLLFGLRVVDMTGGPITVGQSILRSVARPSASRAFFMEASAGDVLSHDRFTRTRVVRASELRRLKAEARASRRSAAPVPDSAPE